MKKFWFLLLFGVNAFQVTTSTPEFTTLKPEKENSTKVLGQNEDNFTTSSGTSLTLNQVESIIGRARTGQNKKEPSILLKIFKQVSEEF